ncbi:MAG: hypothetical protein ABGW82_08130, partial [Paracoccus sp. (in: a-proteobacteria)]
RLVPYDSSGNAGTPSNQVTIEVAALVDVSNFPDTAMADLYARTGQFLDLSADNFSANLIEGQWVKTGTLETQHLSVSARAASVLPNSAMEELSPLFPTRPNYWDPWYGGTVGNDTATPISGGRSLRVSLDADTDSAGGNANGGSWYPVVAGQKWAIRGLVRPNAAIPSGKALVLRFQTSTPATNPNAIFDADASWQAVTLNGPLNSGQFYEMAGTFTVPAGHTKMGIGWGFPGLTGAYSVDVDQFDVFPAVTDSQITEVGAGKIKTGVLQATERIVAGGLTGARAELNGLGFQAFNSSGAKTFEVLASSGDVFGSGTWTTGAIGSGSGSGTRVTIGAAQNPYETGQSWGTIQFFPQDQDWPPGLIWGAYGVDDGPLDWGQITVASPRLGTREPARITLRSEEQTNATSLDLRAQTLSTEAKIHLFGDDGAGRVVIRQRYAGGFQGFSFQSPGGKRLNIDLDTIGTSIIQAKDENNAQAKLALDGSTIEFI